MDHITSVGHRLGQQRTAELAREIEFRRRAAERREVEHAAAPLVRAAPVREPSWHRLLVRVHLTRPLAH